MDEQTRAVFTAAGLEHGDDWHLAEVAGETVLVIHRSGMLLLAAAIIDRTVSTSAARLRQQRREDDLYQGWAGLT